MRMSDWSSDVCSSDLSGPAGWCCSRGSGRSSVRTQRICDMSSVRRISIFGATGSVGQSTLDLIDHDPENYDVVALTANRNADALAQAARRHCASIAVVADESAYARSEEHTSELQSLMRISYAVF